MLVNTYHILGRLFRLFPKTTQIKIKNMNGRFFVPINCHYVCDDLSDMCKGRREPKLYDWLNELPINAVYFDIGTSYGQEAVLASTFVERNVKVIGFDCNLYHSHFCCLNRALNNNRFEFIFGAVSDKSGKLISIETNSDTHISQLHKKNVPYSYNIVTISLDDYSKTNKIIPTHIKIDVDGAEKLVINGAKVLLSNKTVKDIFIEIDHKNMELKETILNFGFDVVWEEKKAMNTDILFRRK